MKIISISFLFIFLTHFSKDPGNEIHKNGVDVYWSFRGDRIFFKMKAPTTGWVAIGFNEKAGIQDTYLLMGHVLSGRPQVVEHYTLKPGNYRTIESLKAVPKVADLQGEESSNQTWLSFSLPIKGLSPYQKDFIPGTKYHLLVAYSKADDFQHHSIMRSSLEIQL